MLLKILISFILTILLLALIYGFMILLIKTLEKIERYLDKKRNKLGKEKYEKNVWYIETILIVIVSITFLTFLTYRFVFDYLVNIL